jgi:hypothetical protein
MTSLRPWTLAALVALAACSGGTPADTEPVETQEEPGLPDKIAPPGDADERMALVPSPVETQKALEGAGVEQKLADLIPQREFKVDKDDKDGVAVRTGVVTADMLLTVKTASDEQLQRHLQQIRDGMLTLEGGDDIDATIADIQDRVKAGAADRDDLLKELDELTGAIIPELKFNGKDRMVPLIQAGSWLGGSNLVAKAIKDAGKPEAANTLLKQPAVVGYFQKYVREEGKELAPASVTQKLDESLQKLKELAEKPESLNAEDVDMIIKVTDDVLALL